MSPLINHFRNSTSYYSTYIMHHYELFGMWQGNLIRIRRFVIPLNFLHSITQSTWYDGGSKITLKSAPTRPSAPSNIYQSISTMNQRNGYCLSMVYWHRRWYELIRRGYQIHRSRRRNVNQLQWWWKIGRPYLKHKSSNDKMVLSNRRLSRCGCVSMACKKPSSSSYHPFVHL